MICKDKNVLNNCVMRESNPQLNLGRVPCYHYTNDAWLLVPFKICDV